MLDTGKRWSRASENARQALGRQCGGDRDGMTHLLAEAVGDGQRADAGQGADAQLDGDDEPVVAVDERKLDQHQRDQVVWRRRDRPEVDLAILEFPPAIGGHAGEGHRRRDGGLADVLAARLGVGRAQRDVPGRSEKSNQSRWPSTYSGVFEHDLAGRGRGATANSYSMRSGTQGDGPSSGSLTSDWYQASHMLTTPIAAWRSGRRLRRPVPGRAGRDWGSCPGAGCRTGAAPSMHRPATTDR